jgi:hypothetical protein
MRRLLLHRLSDSNALHLHLHGGRLKKGVSESGKHQGVVNGIHQMSLLWTGGDSHLPCNYRLCDKAHDALSKNDHFFSTT